MLYVVQDNDTLFSIAAALGVTLEQLTRAGEWDLGRRFLTIGDVFDDSSDGEWSDGQRADTADLRALARRSTEVLPAGQWSSLYARTLHWNSKGAATGPFLTKRA